MHPYPTAHGSEITTPLVAKTSRMTIATTATSEINPQSAICNAICNLASFFFKKRTQTNCAKPKPLSLVSLSPLSWYFVCGRAQRRSRLEFVFCHDIVTNVPNPA